MLCDLDLCHACIEHDLDRGCRSTAFRVVDCALGRTWNEPKFCPIVEDADLYANVSGDLAPDATGQNLPASLGGKCKGRWI